MLLVSMVAAGIAPVIDKGQGGSVFRGNNGGDPEIGFATAGENVGFLEKHE
jgi:hypothetical protein